MWKTLFSFFPNLSNSRQRQQQEAQSEKLLGDLNINAPQNKTSEKQIFILISIPICCKINKIIGFGTFYQQTQSPICTILRLSICGAVDNWSLLEFSDCAAVLGVCFSFYKDFAPLVLWPCWKTDLVSGCCYGLVCWVLFSWLINF